MLRSSSSDLETRIRETIADPIRNKLISPVNHRDPFHDDYYPQIGDQVAFFKTGYKKWLRRLMIPTDFKTYVHPLLKNKLLSIPNLPELLYCKITDIQYRLEFVANHVPLTIRTITLYIEQIPHDQVLTHMQERLVGRTIVLDYVDHPNCSPTFLILKQLHLCSAQYFSKIKPPYSQHVLHISVNRAFQKVELIDVSSDASWEKLKVRWGEGDDEDETDNVNIWEAKQVEECTDLRKVLPKISQVQKEKLSQAFSEFLTDENLRMIPPMSPMCAYPLPLNSIKLRLDNDFYHDVNVSIRHTATDHFYFMS